MDPPLSLSIKVKRRENQLTFMGLFSQLLLLLWPWLFNLQASLLVRESPQGSPNKFETNPTSAVGYCFNNLGKGPCELILLFSGFF